jgi:asparagine synthase (glutamine-hydrolysing)
MCGVAGILTLAPEAAYDVDERIRQMVVALGHRGPDGRGVWSREASTGQVAAFGHARLAIIDLSDAGAQPMVRDENAVTFNGEIYNYRALRGRLTDKGHQFRTNSDTEVLLAAYREYGSDVARHLDGMFAFGLWDAGRERLVLARDRFGVKPLYWYQDTRHLVFASEVRALLASGLVTAKLSGSALWHYAGYQTTPTPATLLDGISMLEPGSVMEVELSGRTAARRYWDLLEAAAHEDCVPSPAAAQSRIAALLDDAVQSHLVSDVPVGVFLSGGLDSGALVSALSSAGIRPRTFTVALADADLDESRAAAGLAHHFKTDHTEIRLDEDDLVDELPDILASIDHPSGDAVNTYAVSKAVSDRGLKVAMSGLGGDEIFAGYASFRRLGRLAGPAASFGRAPKAMRRAAASLVRVAGAGSVTTEKAAAVLETEGSLADVWPVTRQLFSEAARARLLPSRALGTEDAYAPMLAAAFDRSPASSMTARVSYAESRAYMHDVLLRDTDQMSMRHALEVRVPLLDHRLASFVVSLQDDWKFSPATNKPLLVNSLAAPLPFEIAGAPKRGFALPFDKWMRGALRPFCELQLGPRGLDGRGLLKPGEGGRLWSRFLNRAPGVTWGRVWALVALNAWLERRSL